MTHAPKLAYNDWQVIDKTTLLVWANDIQFFDIRPADDILELRINDIQFFDIRPADDILELRINNAADGTAVCMGNYTSVGKAIVRARKWLDAEEDQS